MRSKGVLEEVTVLLDDRRKYEGWLAALDAKAESAPAQVFQRVRDDYQARLDAVDERLAGFRDTLSEELSGLQSRLALIDAEIQIRSDERAEVELRAAVGELSEGDVSKSLKSVAETIEKLEGERGEIAGSAERISTVLSATPAGRDAAPEAGADSPFETRHLGETPTQPHGTVSVPATATPPSTRETSGLETRPDPDSSAPVSDSRLASEESPTGQSRRTPFDEMAFLSSVFSEPNPVGLGEASPGATDAFRAPAATAHQPEAPQPPAAIQPPSGRDEIGTSPSLLPAVGGDEARSAVGPESRRETAPLGANIPGHTPIRLRTSAQLETPKTLKCGECGSMNYATEWYCERCGAELATL